jgi:hypothetical protein
MNLEKSIFCNESSENKLRNSMNDELLNHCLVIFIEREVFINVSDDAIVKTFMAMRQRGFTK